MKKQFSLAISCLLLTAGLTFGQTASFSLLNAGNTSFGTYNPNDIVTLSLFGTFNTITGSPAAGFSLWLEAPTANGFNTAISITSATQIQFSITTQNVYPKSFTDTAGADPGYLTDKQGALSGDLGAIAGSPSEYFINTTHLADYTFTLTNAAPGTYTIYTVANNPKMSGMNDDMFNYYSAGQVGYRFTIVPEPSTWSLLVISGLGAIVFSVRRQRRRIVS